MRCPIWHVRLEWNEKGQSRNVTIIGDRIWRSKFCCLVKPLNFFSFDACLDYNRTCSNFLCLLVEKFKSKRQQTHNCLLIFVNFCLFLSGHNATLWWTVILMLLCLLTHTVCAGFLKSNFNLFFCWSNTACRSRSIQQLKHHYTFLDQLTVSWQHS